MEIDVLKSIWIPGQRISDIIIYDSIIRGILTSTLRYDELNEIQSIDYVNTSGGISRCL